MQPTRTGTSVARDTTPDLTFVKMGTACSREAQRRNTGADLCSDHMILEVRIPLAGRNNYGKKTHKHTDWEAFRRALPETHDDIEDIQEWTTAVMKTVDDATQEIETDEDIDKMDSRLAHILEAKSSLKARWLKQHTNRRLRKRIAELNKQIAKHCRVLCPSN